MKKLLLALLTALPFCVNAGTVGMTNAIVPAYMEGSTTSTNNNRVPCWFYAEIIGLGPNMTYHYFTAMDTVNDPSANGAGLPYLINAQTRTIRRILNPSMTSNTGYDSLTTDASGTLRGWFAVEPTGNGRFLAGKTVFPKIMLNNGTGGTTVMYRITGMAYPISVIAFGTTSMSATQGSALWDSLNATPKNFICAYDNVSASGRPIGIGIVENDSLQLRPVSSIAAFYRNRVDSLNFHWGIIVPNNLPNGIRALEERRFTDGMPVDTVTDSDGIWCFGTNTVNMSNGNIAQFLNSTFVLNGNAMIPDTTWTGLVTTFNAGSNSPNSTYSWNFGDSNTGTGATATHTYTSAGVVNVQLIISTGGCSDTINHTVVVMLTTGVITPMPLSFQVMPNPTSGEIIINTRENNEKVITVTDMLGQLITTQQYNGTSLRFDLAGNPNGIYFVQVKDTVTGKTGTKKIVLQ